MIGSEFIIKKSLYRCICPLTDFMAVQKETNRRPNTKFVKAYSSRSLLYMLLQNRCIINGM